MRAVVVVGLCWLAASATAAAKPASSGRPDPEAQARTAFTDGHYADALARYQKLYDETHHPTYLRNVGRCQQMLKQADEAIATFREYLRVAPNLSQPARDEVEGFIRDMQELKRQRDDKDARRAAAPPIRAPEPQPRAFTPDPRATIVYDGPFNAPQPPPPPHRTWPWLAGGALVVAAGVLTAVLLSQSPKSACPTCTLPKVSIETH